MKRATFYRCYRLLAIVIVAIAPATVLATPYVGSYFTAWSPSQGFQLKRFDQSGLADRYNYLNYAFANVYRMPDGSYQCQNGRDVDNQDAGLGMKATADYGFEFGADESVDGSADQHDQTLAGNFNQLRELKARHPNLKILLSIGGWDWSRWFSAAAMTPSSRHVLVASCIDLYIKGNLPPLNGHGGPGAAANLFDGFDLDWEHPGMQGAGYNTFSSHDRKNFTFLLQEFRTQLDLLGKHVNKRYYLSAAIGASEKNIQKTDPGRYSRSLDWINLMSYDFHGAWDQIGPTDFQSNLYSDPSSPDPEHPSVDKAVSLLLKAGVKPAKIVVGIPIYGRGWRGVGPGNNGLYQPAQGPVPTKEVGIDSYAHLAALGTGKHYDPVTKQLWTYDGDVFWSYDDETVVRDKASYVQRRGLGGLMSWAIDQDDEHFTVSRAMLSVQ